MKIDFAFRNAARMRRSVSTSRRSFGGSFAISAGSVRSARLPRIEVTPTAATAAPTTSNTLRLPDTTMAPGYRAARQSRPGQLRRGLNGLLRYSAPGGVKGREQEEIQKGRGD